MKEGQSERRVSRCYFIPALFSGGREKERDQGMKGKTGESSGEEGREAGEPRELTPDSVRVRLIDKFRLEIFAAPYAPNRCAHRKIVDESFITRNENDDDDNDAPMMTPMMIRTMTTICRISFLFSSV